MQCLFGSFLFVFWGVFFCGGGGVCVGFFNMLMAWLVLVLNSMSCCWHESSSAAQNHPGCTKSSSSSGASPWQASGADTRDWECWNPRQTEKEQTPHRNPQQKEILGFLPPFWQTFTSDSRDGRVYFQRLLKSFCFSFRSIPCHWVL